MNQLSKHGYIIEFLQPYSLYIDWGTQKNLMSSSSGSSNNKLKSQTKTLLEKFPNASKIEYFLEDASIPEFKYNSNKHLIKKKRKK